MKRNLITGRISNRLMSTKYIFTGADREQYTKGQLEVSDIDPSSPFPNFHRWFKQAKEEGITADACCLSTAEVPTGRVSSRMVLLKELDTKGFVMYASHLFPAYSDTPISPHRGSRRT